MIASSNSESSEKTQLIWGNEISLSRRTKKNVYGNFDKVRNDEVDWDK